MNNLKPKTVNVSHLTMAEKMAMENEGFTEKPYHCTAGRLSIGYGRNLEDRGITWSEAKSLLAADLLEAHNVLFSELAFFQGLSDPRKAVLMDMYHNLGLTRLLKFQRMLTALRYFDYDEAANQLRDSQYWGQVGRRAKRNYCMIKFDRFFETDEASKIFQKNQR